MSEKMPQEFEYWAERHGLDPSAGYHAWLQPIVRMIWAELSEEKEAFSRLLLEFNQEHGLRTHENVGQESGAGAILYMAKNLHSKSYATSRSKAEAELFLLQSGLKVDGKEAAVIPLYLAPPSAPAIEYAAIMRAAEVCRAKQRKLADLVDAAIEYGDEKYITVYEQQAATVMQLWEAIRALIPQDGRTQLAEIFDKVLNCYSPDDTITDYQDKIRAIVNNLIGVPPLNSESVSGEK